MLPLSTGEIELMRDVSDAAQPGTAVIHTPTTAQDGQGGYIQTFAASGTATARLAPLNGSELPLAERLGAINAFALTLPAATTVTTRDRVVYAGTTYEVTHVAPWTPWEIARRVMVAEIA